MTTPVDDFNKWLTMPTETANLEFKEASTQFDNTKLYRHCVALGNEGGGKLVLGVTDAPPRKVIGTASFHTPAGIQAKILDKLRFRVEVEELQHPDGRVVIFHIPPRPRGTAYQLDGAYFMRSPEGTVPMSEDRLRQIFNEGKPDWLMSAASEPYSEDEVIRLLDTRVYFDLTKQTYPSTRDGEIARFESEKLIVKEGGRYVITNLGALLFAKELDRFEGLSRKAPRVVVYEGPNKLKKNRVFVVGTKGYANGFIGLIDFINAQIPSNELVGKAIRTEVKMFSSTSVRELVANALIHQDFNETGTSVTIEIYTDRMEVMNPGVPIILPDRFIDEYQSRNERLADLMRRMGVCEEQGKGIDRVISHAEVYQLPAPDFRVSQRHTTAVLFAHKSFDRMDGKERVRACFQHCVLRWMTNQKMNNQSLRERFNLPDGKTELVSAIIADAIREGRIKPDNPENMSRRYAKYIPYWA